jgi:hypothetical protein
MPGIFAISALIETGWIRPTPADVDLVADVISPSMMGRRRSRSARRSLGNTLRGSNAINTQSNAPKVCSNIGMLNARDATKTGSRTASNAKTNMPLIK